MAKVIQFPRAGATRPMGRNEKDVVTSRINRSIRHIFQSSLTADQHRLVSETIRSLYRIYGRGGSPKDIEPADLAVVATAVTNKLGQAEETLRKILTASEEDD